jgi:CHAD domain-containing protein/transposase-like protein
MEIEAKFSAPDAATLERLDLLNELAGYELGGREVADMSDVYLDSDERALQAAGMVCRRRDRGDRVVITVKRRGGAPGDAKTDGGQEDAGAAGAAIHRRTEWEVDLPASSSADLPTSWPAGETREQVLSAVGKRPLLPLVEVRQSRVLSTLTKDGRTVAELSLDTLVIVAGDAPLPPAYEVEAELKGEGTEADLAAIAAALQGEFGLAAQPLSKFERAMAALAREPRAGGLLTRDEEHLLTRIARRTDAVGRRARVLLAIHDGALQRDAATRAGVAPRTVRYWLNRFRHEGLAIFPKRLITRAPRRAEHGPAPAASPAAPSAPAAAPAATAPPAATTSRPKVAADKKAAGKAKRVKPTGKAAAAHAKPTAAEAPAKLETAGAATPAALNTPSQTPAASAAPTARVRRPARPGIRKSDTMAEAAFKMLRFQFDRMLDHEAGTREGGDIEDLHDMRVATRRMRAALRVFGPYLDAGVMRPIDRGLRRTGRVLGAVRDLDVFHEKTMVYLGSLPESRHGDLEPLLAVWRERREHARGAMIEYLDGGRYPRFVEAFNALLDDPGRASLGFIDDDGEARPHRVAHVLPAVLYDRVAGVWAYDDVIAGHDTPLVRFHRLRIAGKAMRYTFEFFEEVLGSDAKPLIGATKDMQDHLGDLQDAVVTCNVLRNFLTWGTWEPPAANARRALTMIVAPGVATYLAARQEELNRLVDTFPEMWAKIRGDGFSRRLAKVVGEL